jgi:hypothetical protein
MNKKLLWLASGLFVVVLAMRLAGGASFWRHYAAAMWGGDVQAAAKLADPRLKLVGAATPPPRATAEAELIEAAALQQASELAQQQGATALLIHRHGHRVHEYYAPGRSDATQIGGGELSAALFSLSLGALVDAGRLPPDAAVAAIREATAADESWRNPWSAAAQRRFNLAPPPAVMQQDLEGSIADTISARVWQPLGAADAALWGVGDAQLRLDCCVAAQVADWMRIADLLLQQGNYQGQRIASPDWIRRLLATDDQGRPHPVWLGEQLPWSGDEPPATREVYWFDLGSDARLWLVPRRGLALLYWAGKGQARDTLLPNIILRGLQDQLPSGGTGLNDLVPGHGGH